MQYKRIQIRLGRYGEAAWTDFLVRLSAIQKATRTPVRSELQAKEIRESIREDLRPGVRPHESGLDVKSIAVDALLRLQTPITRDRARQELQAAKSELALLEAMVKDRQKRIAELSGDRSGALSERLAEIEKAKARAAEKVRLLPAAKAG